MLKKTLRIDAWAVICNKNCGHQAFTDNDKAKKHCKFLNDEYKGYCRHKVKPCQIVVNSVWLNK